MTNTPPLEQSVRHLQKMLRSLSQLYPQLPLLEIDGIFGEHTLEAVMIFQRDFFPPVTGVINTDTWHAIQGLYRALQAAPQHFPIPDALFPIQPGEQMPQLRLVQAMLDALAGVLSGFERTEQDGILHGSTLDGIRALQEACGLLPTGILDLRTWACLNRAYRIFTTQVQ